MTRGLAVLFLVTVHAQPGAEPHTEANSPRNIQNRIIEKSQRDKSGAAGAGALLERRALVKKAASLLGIDTSLQGKPPDGLDVAIDEMSQNLETYLNKLTKKVEDRNEEASEVVEGLTADLEAKEQAVADMIVEIEGKEEESRDKEDLLKETIADYKEKVAEVKWARKNDFDPRGSELKSALSEHEREIKEASKEYLDSMEEISDDGAKEWQQMVRETEKDLKAMEKEQARDFEDSLQDSQDDFEDGYIETMREVFASLRSADPERYIKRLQTEFKAAKKYADKATSDAHKKLSKNIVANSEKMYAKATKKLTKMVQKTGRDLEKDQKRLIKKITKKMKSWGSKTLKRITKAGKKYAKDAKNLEKQANRQMSADATSAKDLADLIEDSSGMLADIQAQTKTAEETIARFLAAVEPAAEAVKSSVDTRSAEIEQEADNAIAEEEEKVKGALEQSVVSATSGATAAFNALQDSTAKEIQDLSRDEQAQMVAMRDRSAEAATMQEETTREHDRVAEVIYEGGEVASSSQTAVEEQRKKLEKTLFDDTASMRHAVRDFNSDVRAMMAKITASLQEYTGATGEGSIPTITAAGMQQATTEATEGLAEVSSQAKEELQSIVEALQEVQATENSQAQHLRTVMGADGSGSASAYSQAVNEFPMRGAAEADKAERAEHRMEEIANNMQKEVEGMEGRMFGRAGAVDLAIGQERSAITTAANELVQQMASLVDTNYERLFDDVDGIKRTTEETLSQYRLDAKDIGSADQALEKRVQDLASRNRALDEEQQAMDTVMREEAPSKTTLQQIAQTIKTKLEEKKQKLKMSLERMFTEAEDESKRMVRAGGESLQQRSKDERQYISMAVQQLLAAMKKEVEGAEEAGQAVKSQVEQFAGRTDAVVGQMEQKNNKLRDQASTLVMQGEKQDKEQQQLYSQLSLEALMNKNQVEDEMRESIQSASTRGQADRAALKKSQEQKIEQMRNALLGELQEGKQNLAAVKTTATDHAIASEKTVEQAVYSSKEISRAAEEQKKDAEASLERDEKAEEYAVEEEEDDIKGMQEQDSVVGKRMNAGLTTLDAKAKDFGTLAVDEITAMGHKIESEAEMARTKEETIKKSMEAEQSMAAEDQDRRDDALARAVGAENAKIEDVTLNASRLANATKLSIAELKTLIGEEQKTLEENVKYLKSYTGQSAAKILMLISDVVKQELQVTHGAFSSMRSAKNNLEAWEHMMDQVTGSEAFKSLEKIANADELAVRIDASNSQLAYWLKRFETESLDWRKRVEEAFEDAEVLQELQGDAMDTDRKEQEANAAKMGMAMEQKMNGMLQNIQGTDMSELAGTMGSSIDMVKQVGKTRDQATNQLIGNLDQQLLAAQDKSKQSLDQASGDLDKIVEGNKAAHKQLSNMDKMLLALQKQEDERLAAQKAAIDARAKAFDKTLLLGPDGEANLEKPDISALKEQVKVLSAQHTKLEQRHQDADVRLKAAIGSVMGALHVASNDANLAKQQEEMREQARADALQKAQQENSAAVSAQLKREAWEADQAERQQRIDQLKTLQNTHVDNVNREQIASSTMANLIGGISNALPMVR